MPMTPWADIVGYTCLECGRWATHWYGHTPICCSCHYGGNESDDFMEQEAIRYNTLFQKGLPLDEPDYSCLDYLGLEVHPLDPVFGYPGTESMEEDDPNYQWPESL